MEDDWESAAGKPIVDLTDKLNKWPGEDADDDMANIKESWEDEEEKKDEEKSEPPPPQVPPPVIIKPSKAAKGTLPKDEDDVKSLDQMTSEERMAEKMRLQKIQEESDLSAALETFGIKAVGGGLDGPIPKTEEEFKELGATLSWKFAQCKESAHFPQFVEDLVRNICAHLQLSKMKKVKTIVENIHSEKLKAEKLNSKKPSSKPKTKITLKNGTSDIETFNKYGTDFTDGYDEYDDFM